MSNNKYPTDFEYYEADLNLDCERCGNRGNSLVMITSTYTDISDERLITVCAKCCQQAIDFINENEEKEVGNDPR